MRIILAVLMIVLGAGLSHAQEGATKQIGDWTLRCNAQQNGGEVCSLRQRITAGETLMSEVSLNMVQIDGAPRVLMVMNVPEGAALNIAPGYIVDGAGDAVNLSWRTCLRDLCRAAAILTQPQQGAIMAGNVMTLGYRKFREDKTTAFPVSLRGVTAGLAALSAR